MFHFARISFVPDYPHAKHFSWDKYLEETSSLPAPARAFKVVRKSLNVFHALKFMWLISLRREYIYTVPMFPNVSN